MQTVQQLCFFEDRATRRSFRHVLFARNQAVRKTSYLLYLPDDYDNEQKFPLVLFLHGSGERGRDPEKIKQHGLPKLIDEGQKFPFIVVSPQCPAHHRWDIELLGRLLDEVEQRYLVDPDRIYLTGLSMGGGATWKLAIRFPQRFAAIVPICGRSMPEQAGNIKHLPIWVFHGAEDTIVPVSESTAMVQALQQHDNAVRFTLYPEVGHNAWKEAYADPQLYEWLLVMRRETDH